MPYEREEIAAELAGKNAVLARLSKLRNELEAIVDYLHDGHDGTSELARQLSECKLAVPRLRKQERELRKEGNHEQADKKKLAIARYKQERSRIESQFLKSADHYNTCLDNTSSSAFSLNTFLVRKENLKGIDPSIVTVFEKKINDFALAVEENKEYLGSSTHLFGDNGEFNKSNSIVSVLSDLSWREGTLSAYINGVKRLYNQQHTVVELQSADADTGTEEKSNKRSYLVELHTAQREGQDLSEWISVLCDKPTVKQRLKELKKNRTQEEAEEALLQEIALGYLKQRDEKYFDQLAVSDAEKKGIKDLLSEKTLEQDEITKVMVCIRAELDKNRRVHVALQLENKKDKTISLYIKQWTTLFAVLGTIGEACLSTYAVVQALGYTAKSGTLFHFLGSHPGVSAAAAVVFVSVLLVNTVLFNMLMKDLLGVVAKKRLMKNKDGTDKTKVQKQTLGWGMFISVITAVGLGALSFNGCQAAFSTLLQASPLSTAVLAISLAIAAVTFLAMVSFNYQFFLEVFSDLKGYKKQLDRMFLKGRCKTAKAFLLGLCSALAVLYTIGSLMVNFASLDKMLQCFSVAQMASKSLNGMLTGISGFFYVLAGFSANRSMLQLFRDKCSEITRFFKTNSGKHIAAKMIAVFVKTLASIVLFFPAAVVLVAARMVLASVKLLINFVGLVAGLLTGLGALIVGKSFKQGFHACATLNQKVVNSWDKGTGWWKDAFMFCAKRGGLFAAVLNAVSQAALRQVDMKGINAAVIAPTLLDSALLSALPNADALNTAVNADESADMVQQVVDNSTDSACCDDGVNDSMVGVISAKKLTFWGTFGSSMAEQFTPVKNPPKSAEHQYIDDMTRTASASAA